jgi:hypothetical protein
MALPDDLPAAGPRWLAGFPESLPVNALDVDLVRFARLLADDPDRLADVGLEGMLV